MKTKKHLSILVLVSAKNQKTWEKVRSEFTKYFDMEDIVDRPTNIENYLDQSIDILFLDNKKYFKMDYYPIFQKNNNTFSYQLICDKPDPEKDVQSFKSLADRIIYTNISKELTKWEILSSLRRYWNTYSKNSTIIFKGIVADFVDSNFSVEQKRVDLTPKEASILRILLLNKRKYVSKKVIFKEIWGHDIDNTRTVDQTLFKLKKKIGDEYFVITRNKGVMIA